MYTKNNRRVKRLKKKKFIKGGSIWHNFVKSIIILIGILFVVSVVLTFKRQDNISFVTKDKIGNTYVNYYDFNDDSFNVFYIPHNTQVEVSRNYGVWTFGSIWELSERENLEGKLVSETVTKSLGFPVTTWFTGVFEHINGMPKITLSNVLFNNNVPIKNKIGFYRQVGLVPKSKVNKIDLIKLGYLKKATLNDGSEGYLRTDTQVFEVASVLDKIIDGRYYKVKLEDFAKVYGFDDRLISHITSLGGNVVMIDRSTKEEFYDCTVRGIDKSLVNYVSESMDCVSLVDDSVEKYDIIVTYGRKYFERY